MIRVILAIRRKPGQELEAMQSLSSMVLQIVAHDNDPCHLKPGQELDALQSLSSMVLRPHLSESDLCGDRSQEQAKARTRHVGMLERSEEAQPCSEMCCVYGYKRGRACV